MGSIEKQLMWIHGLLPRETRKKIGGLCLRENEGIGMSERFLAYPPHVSLKRSFYAENSREIEEGLKEMLEGFSKIGCGDLYPFRIADMIWLRFGYEEELRKIHEQIDLFLNERYMIPIDEFDRNYCPHVTLFCDEDPQKLDAMYGRIGKELCFRDQTIGEVTVGGSSFRLCDNREE